jgi:hypothetical protein
MSTSRSNSVSTFSARIFAGNAAINKPNGNSKQLWKIRSQLLGVGVAGFIRVQRWNDDIKN